MNTDNDELATNFGGKKMKKTEERVAVPKSATECWSIASRMSSVTMSCAWKKTNTPRKYHFVDDGAL